MLSRIIWLAVFLTVFHRECLVSTCHQKSIDKRRTDFTSLLIGQHNLNIQENYPSQDLQKADMPVPLLKRLQRRLLSSQSLFIALAVGLLGVSLRLLLSSSPEFFRALSDLYSFIHNKLFSHKIISSTIPAESTAVIPPEKPFVIPQTNYVATIIDLMSKEKETGHPCINALSACQESSAYGVEAIAGCVQKICRDEIYRKCKSVEIEQCEGKLHSFYDLRILEMCKETDADCIHGLILECIRRTAELCHSDIFSSECARDLMRKAHELVRSIDT